MKPLGPVRLEPCTPGEYTRLLAFLDAAFEKPYRFWFPRNYGHIFLPTEESVKCHHLFKSGNTIIGAVGIYPLKLKIATAVLSASGIGSVSVASQYRSRGVMTAMLREAIRIMREKGDDISWLSGDRRRYRTHGWELGGRRTIYTILRKDLIQYGVRPSKSIRIASERHIDTLSRLYCHFSCRVLRSAETWERQLRRKNLRWIVSESKEGAAYMVHFRGEPDSIQEIQADTSAAAVSLLLAHANRHHLEKISVSHADAPDHTARALADFSADFRSTHCAQLLILNPEAVWKKLLPVLKSSHPGIDRFDSIVAAKDKAALLGRALGYFNWWPPLSAGLRSFRSLSAVPWWMSVVDWV